MALRIPNKDTLATRQNDAERFVVPGAKARFPRDEISDRWIHVSLLQLERTGRHGLSPFSSLRMPDDQVTTGILLADALGDGRLGPAQGRSVPPVLLALHDPSGETAYLGVYRRLPLNHTNKHRCRLPACLKGVNSGGARDNAGFDRALGGADDTRNQSKSGASGLVRDL